MDDRAAFEKAISSPPYERDVSRYPEDQRFGWPGLYKTYEVSLAWDMWQAAIQFERERSKK